MPSANPPASFAAMGAAQPELFEFRRHGVSFVFQTFNVFPALTALENAVRRRCRRARATRVADRVIELSSGRVVRVGPPEGGQVEIADLRW